MALPHPVATKGFGLQAGVYATTRPTYPSTAIHQIRQLVPQGATVLDLAAGTGIMTKLLVESGYTVTAVEPVAAMRDKLVALIPGTTCLEGTAWDIPVTTHSQDAVVVAQAFHWFADIKSLEEIHRVLRPQGHLILVWNMESKERSQWVAKLRNLYERYDVGVPQYRSGKWRQPFESAQAAELYRLPLKQAIFMNDYGVPRSAILNRILTKSYVAVLPDEDKERLIADAQGVLDDDTNDLVYDSKGQVLYPHDTELVWTQSI